MGGQTSVGVDVQPGSALAATAFAGRIRVPSVLDIWAWALVSGTIVFSVSVLFQWLVYDYWGGETGMRLVSPGVAGVCTAALVFRARIISRRTKIAIVRRLEIIAEMNHHVRNSLQVLSFTAYTDPVAAERVREAVERIEWSLNALLPEVHVERPEPGARRDART